MGMRLLRGCFLSTLALSLAGCTHIRRVDRTVKAPHVLDATLQQLNTQLAEQYTSIQSFNASVDITATTGGKHEGEVKESSAFPGYILMRKPSDLRTLMMVPLARSLALDMVSDGKNFKLVIPPRSIAREGADGVAVNSKPGLESLRPNIIRESILVPAMQADELVNLTENARILPPAAGKKESIEEPDYDLTISRVKTGHELETVRVIHIGRVTLKPYEQDIYDHAGRLVTVVTYDKYQKFGEIWFPTSILITRPIDEYTLKIDIMKMTMNPKLDDDQFQLKFPDNISIQKM